MPRRQPYKKYGSDLPRLWFVTDERQGDAVLASIAALPPKSGIIFRHYQTEATTRRALFEESKILAHKAGHFLILSDNVVTANAWQANGVHLTRQGAGRLNAVRYARQNGLLVSMTAHNHNEIRQANRLADLILISPVYATASHDGARTLGVDGFVSLTKGVRKPLVALGGMTASRFGDLSYTSAHGWAAIDALTVDSITQD